MKISKLFSLLLAAAVLLSACQLPAAPAADVPENAPQAVFTAAAQTAQARLDVLALTQTAQPTRTGLPTMPPTLTPTISPTPEVLTGTLTGPISILPGGEDRAEYVTDLSIPDGTIFRPGESFTKSWRLKNAGQTTWTTDYDLVFAGGDLMGGLLSKPLAEQVLPGQIVDISANLIAPPAEGTFQGFWALRNAQGRVFGMGANADEAFWVTIIAQGVAVTSTPAATEMQGVIGSVLLMLDEPNYSGPCPHTFNFRVEITMNEPEVVHYVITSDNDANVDVNLPPPGSYNLEIGTHPAIFELTVSESMSGWLRIDIVNPVIAQSNRLHFQVTCQ